MENSIRLLVLSMVLGWSASAFAGDWYVHRTSHAMKVPPWYCYCYRATTANVIPATPTHPLDMQISRALAFSKLATYAALPETCPNNCQFGGRSSAGRAPARDHSLEPKRAKSQSPKCQQLAKVGGCEGFCRGFAAGYDVAARVITKCITDCKVKKVEELGCAS